MPSSGPAVTVDQNGTRAGPGSTADSTSASSPSRASTCRECAEKSTPGTFHRITPAFASTLPRSRSPSGSPETTTVCGPLTAATETRSPSGAIRSRTHSCEATIDSIPPLPLSARRARLRSAEIRAPSSRDSAPATHAAAISPWEWPTTAEGSSPAARHTSASETITAHSAGWTTSTSDSAASSSRTSESDQSTCSSSSRSHNSSRAAKTGEVSRSRRAMPAHWEPCPGKTHTVPDSGATAPSTTRGEGSPVVSAARPSSSSARSPATTTPRCSSAERVVTVEKAMSSGSASGSDSTRSSSRPACARSAVPVAAETTTGAGAPAPERGAFGPADSVPSASGSGSGSEGCSRITCALVPLAPKADTPARRGRPSAVGQGRCPVSSSTEPADQSMCGDGSWTCSVRGSTPCRIASTILITPVTPAAAWVCPRLDFTEPSHSGSVRCCP